jgi:DNA helicase HerA-like ATPase
LALLRGSLVDCPNAALDIRQLLGLAGQAGGGKTALAIISTKFLGDNSTVDFWMSQFLTALDRWVNKHPKAALQALLLLDEADVYLPANRQPATKWPMENLLKRARAAGLGIMLATQSPGDLDYKCRENIRSWFLGRVQQETALRKLRTVFDARSDMISRLQGQAQGQFVLARDGQPESFKSNRSALNTVVLEEEQILRLARGENW